MRVPIVFATNDKYVPHCRVALCSLLDHAAAENEYVVYIFHSGLSEASLTALRAFARENASVRPIDVSAYVGEEMYEQAWYTREIHYRLIAADALPQEDKILYLDCDIVVLEDVAHLYAVDLDDNLIGSLPFEAEAARRMSAALSLEVGSIFNSGVMLFNLAQWRKADVFGQCVEVLRRFRGTLIHPDQDALAIVCGHRSTKIHPRWNGMTCQPNRQGVLQSGIAHMFSMDKPWNSGGDSNYALYYACARRLGVLPPPKPPLENWKRALWEKRHFRRLRPAFLRACVQKLGGAAYMAATAYVPRLRAPLKRVRVAVTARCPGNCPHCEVLCPQTSALPEPEAAQILADLKKLLSHARYIEEMRLTGGEPLARPELADMLRLLLESGRVRRVVVETPGLAAPAPDVRALLQDGRVRVEVHAGVDVPQLNVAYELLDCPPEADVPALKTLPNATPTREWVWADYGPFERRACADDELYWQARACGANDYFYLDGRLFPCARMALGMALGLLPESACRFAEIRREKSAWRIARNLEALLQPRPAEACRYCLRGTTQFAAVPREA